MGDCKAFWCVCQIGGHLCPHMSPLYVCMPHNMSVYPLYVCVPHTSICPPIHHGDIGGHLYISQTLLCLLVHPFVYQFILVIPVAQHHCGSLAVSFMAGFSTYLFWVLFFLLCWTRGLWMYAQATCCLLVLFLCSVFIMSQASATMATTTTPTVTVVCSSISSLFHDCYHGPLP